MSHSSSPSYVQANSGGRLHPATEPAVSPLDRGFLYGDAIYEVWRTYHGVLFAWEEHWSRLGRSARALHLKLPFTPEQILAEIRRTVAAFRTVDGGSDDLYVRLQITRGAGSIGLDPALADNPAFVILVQRCRSLSAQQLEQGLRLSIARELRRNPLEALSPAWKTGNYLNNILCLREARSRGADEVVILNLAGELAEASSSNLAFVSNGELITPPLSAGILAGVTRKLILEEVAARAGIAAREHLVRPEMLKDLEEAMLISTTRDVVPVGAIDALNFRVGPDTITRRLKQAFEEYARDYAADHSDLTVDAD